MNHSHSHAHAHYGDHNAPRLMRLATLASTSLAFVLLAAKTYAWWSTESISMLSSLTDSLFDVLSSLVNLIAIRYALKPADDDHRFGHTSIEDIAGLAQAAFITASMLLIMLQATERLFNPHVLTRQEIGIWVSAGAMVVTVGLVAFQTIVTRRTGSLIIASDRLHYAGDILFNAGVLMAFYLSEHFGFIWADPVIAIVIAVIVLWSTREIGLRAFHNLMNREMPDVQKAQILSILTTMPEIRSHHNLKTRYSGTKPFIQMHVDIDAGLSFRDAHEITDRFEKKLLLAFPGAEVIIHADPRD